jgi:hypothetical protein
MSSAKVAAACVVAALSLSACGVASKPEAGSARAAAVSHDQLNDPRTKHVMCLRADHIGYRELTLTPHRYPSIQVGTRPTGPTIEFLATAGAAQNAQIQGRAQGAEVIGAALVYPNQAASSLMAAVETCMAKGVSG